MLIFWDYRKTILTSVLLSVAASCALQISNDNILSELNNQCKLLPSFNIDEWAVVKSTEQYWELERNDNDGEYLIINNNSGTLLGYYDRKTQDDYLRIRFRDCDTVLYYTKERNNLVIDTFFVKGYYLHLYDENKLSPGQARFFKRNKDSLISIRGGDKRPLPKTNTPLRLD